MRDTRPRCPHCNAETPTPAEAYAHHPTVKPLTPAETATTSVSAIAETVAPFTPGDVAAAAQREAEERAATQATTRQMETPGA